MLVDLAQTPIAVALRQLAQERRSGDLEVRSGPIVKSVFLDHGRIVFAASSLEGDRLGEALLALGRITDDDFRRASELMQGHKTRFGEALVKAGVLDEHEIGRSVARQVDRIVLSLFRLAEGIATFEERRCSIPLEYMVSLSTPRLLYDGIHLLRGEALLAAGLGNLDRRVALARVAPFDFDSQDASDEAREVLEAARSGARLRALVTRDGKMDITRARETYALLASGILVDPDEAPDTPLVQLETGTFLLSALRRRPLPTLGEAARRQVQDELTRTQDLDRDTWLRLAVSSPRVQVERALADKIAYYDSLHRAAGNDRELRTRIEIVLGRATVALTAVRESQTAPEVEPDADPIARLRREGDVRMTVGDPVTAAKAYAALVERAPDVADHHLRLAVALAAHPMSAGQAERAYLAAVRLAPQDPELRYRLALYYRAMRQRSRAIAVLQTAVRVDPRHGAARAELASLSPGDPALDSLAEQTRGA